MQESQSERQNSPLSEHDRQRLKEEHHGWLWLIALSMGAGIALGVVIAALIIQLDIGNVGSLLARSSNRIGFTALLAGGFASLFGMAVCGATIMIVSERRQD